MCSEITVNSLGNLCSQLCKRKRKAFIGRIAEKGFKPGMKERLRDGITITISMSNMNNNTSHDSVYGAVIMTKVIARVHPVHLMNVD